MINATLGVRTTNVTQLGKAHVACKPLSTTNASSSHLADQWENIPETILLNGSIGFSLLLFFLVMTHFAMDRERSDTSGYVDQGLVTFLYGYRDPERWYVAPRYEFLSKHLKNHQHDQDSPKLLIPPQLPIANPFELIMLDDQNQQSGSKEESQSVTSSETNSKVQQNKTPTINNDSQTASKSIKSFKSLKTLKHRSISRQGLSSASRKFIRASKSFMNRDFLYPSVLTSEQFQASYLSRKLNRFFAMFFKVTDTDLIYAKGIDAYEYLLFQRHLILIMFITTTLCLGVILPVHWFSTDVESEGATSFQRTTIKNISYPDSYIAHVVCMSIIVVASMLILNSYKRSIVTKNETSPARRTILIGNIPASQRSRPELIKMLKRSFPTSRIEAVQFVYDTSVLERLEMELSALVSAREYCTQFRESNRAEIMVKQTDVNEGQYCGGYCRLCSFFYMFCCHWPCEASRPGSEFYAEKESLCRNKIKTLCQDLMRNPSEYAFVTFSSTRQAKKVMSNGPKVWTSRYAPHPSNVEYLDLLYVATISKFKLFSLHALMVIIFIFITTPNVVLSILQRWEIFQPDYAKEVTGLKSITINYLSSFVLLLTSALLPTLVALISRQIPYEDTSSKNHSMMWKNYLFLIFMVLVLPSVGMNSAQSFFLSGTEIQTECLFPTDHGSYYINFVLTSVFLSTMIDLIRPVEIVAYYFITMTGRSRADYEQARQLLEREFSVGMQHTTVLLIFTSVMTYTISCPLIAPAGLLFLLVKHGVDQHQLYNTYFTRRVDMDLHHSIDVIVRVSLLLMMFQTSVSIQVDVKAKTTFYPYVCWAIFFACLAVFFINCFLDCTSKAFKPEKAKRKRNYREFCACFYLQRVFQDLIRMNALPEDIISRQVS